MIRTVRYNTKWNTRKKLIYLKARDLIRAFAPRNKLIKVNIKPTILIDFLSLSTIVSVPKMRYIIIETPTRRKLIIMIKNAAIAPKTIPAISSPILVAVIPGRRKLY